MKKRIFIAIHYLEIGGAEISLIGLLNAIDTTRYDVDLFVYRHQGELMKLIPKKIRLLPAVKAYTLIESPIKETIRKGYFHLAGARLWAKYAFNRYAKKHKLQEGSAIFQYVANTTTPFLPSLKHWGTYDLAISFLTPHNIVLKKVSAHKKIAWIHTDYTRISVNTKKELPVWNQYDYIAAISEDAKNAFLKVFPSLDRKVQVIENILSPLFVRERAKAENRTFPTTSAINLLSIGRFTFAKNFDNLPDICRRIREKGQNIHWYIIGYGGEEELIRQRIMEANMQSHITLLGKKENPYPYIAACDVYVQPSRFEGKSVTVREAQILAKPVVITAYPTSASQVQHGIDGIIVPQNNEDCAQAIADFLPNKVLQTQLRHYLQTHDYGNENEVNKIYQLIL